MTERELHNLRGQAVGGVLSLAGWILNARDLAILGGVVGLLVLWRAKRDAS